MSETRLRVMAETAEREFIVRATHLYEYRVKAVDADAAAQIMHDGEVGDGEFVGYSIAAVVSADKASKFWDDDDERANCMCSHPFVAGHSGLWSGKPGELPKPHPRACNTRLCDCLEPVPLPLGEEQP